MIKIFAAVAIALTLTACQGVNIRAGNGGTGSITIKPGVPVVPAQ